jgi:hypothetical protein
MCTLINYGGQQGLFGDMDKVQEGITNVLAAAATDPNTRPIGVGITMEGIW